MCMSNEIATSKSYFLFLQSICAISRATSIKQLISKCKIELTFISHVASPFKLLGHYADQYSFRQYSPTPKGQAFIIKYVRSWSMCVFRVFVFRCWIGHRWLFTLYLCAERPLVRCWRVPDDGVGAT